MVTINLNQDYYKGEKFVIKAKNNDPNNVYLNKATHNEEAILDFTIKHKDITNGGELILEMNSSLERIK